MKGLFNREGVFGPAPPGCVLFLPGLPGGSNKIYDLSPYGNAGAITGATWFFLGQEEWRLGFDGFDDYVDCGANTAFDMSDDFTLEAWIKVTDPTSGTAQGLVWKKDGFTDQYGWGIYVQSGQLYLNYGKAGGYQERGYPFTATRWTHITAGRSGGNFFWMYDGVLKSTQSVTGTPQASSRNLVVGKTGSGHLSGSIALLRVYRRALLLLEAQRHFNDEKHLFGVW